jgi:3',5'-cyclic AMP phosphodiesterase CpdA
MNRRDVLKTIALASAGSVLAVRAGGEGVAAPQRSEAFSFIFFTDTHIQPELNAADGCRMCFGQFTGIPADFAICGGDLVFDALAVDGTRTHRLFDLFQQTASSIHLPIHYVVGNHDVFGVLPKSGVSPSDPEYGKKAFEDRYGPTHYSFDHKGWHFIVLDSIGIHADRTWTGEVGLPQIEWLKADLSTTGKLTPIIVITHVPLVTGAISYVSRQEWASRTNHVGSLVDTLMVTDAEPVIEALLGYNVRVVLQGHTHVDEEIVFRGLRFMTSGAVSGNWWKGIRAGSAEGYSVVTLNSDQRVDRSYRKYGFKSV